MRHRKKINHLGRTTPHRKAMLSNMASSLIIHKRITTTVAKAKELRKFVEPLITRAKEDSTHSRRIVFSYLQDKESVKALFNEVAEKAAERPGGYTRIIKTGNRLGDNAAMCMIELVDFNELLLGEKEDKKTKTRRSRRGGKAKKAETEQVAEAEVVEEENAEVKVEEIEEEKVEAKTGEEVIEEETEKIDENVDEVNAEAEEVAEDSETVTSEKAEDITEEEPEIDQPESTDEEKEENNKDEKAKE